MPWSNQNGSNNDNQNPWGKPPGGGGGNQTPPDLDEVIRRLQERFGSLFGGRGGHGGNRGNGGPELSKGMITGFLALVMLVWGVSGFYKVAADEEAIVLRFGQHVATKGPGLNWHIPYPVETVQKLPVTSIQRQEIGFRHFADGTLRKRTNESLMLTKDENIVDISFIVQYKIKSAEDYLFNIDNPEKTVRDAAESAIREVIGRTLIDDVLTTKKAEVEVETEQLIQSILDSYSAGISVTTVKLQDVQPPERVIKEFKDVASAREDKERAKNEAQAYANDITPKSRGEAKKIVLEAQGYAKEVVEKAKGEASRFDSLLAAYRQAPEVTRKRLYLDTMQEVMTNADKVIVDGSVAKNVLPYLPLDKQPAKAEVTK
ncbi:FtsH protease activity modulator HflK [Mariprofundus ferrooxydans]|uniref:Protein HflK n=1 Tax=Mariprofundus ferrooxydans PV-1 TaxID=314345 RepID=Q0F399_9PROT|nr:FtsH protease activity modulator HflK [Mariprofundus ferrooxydans]EAU56042.1 HflK-like protein [Mariprofundus ferrooxydans PV-1]KON46629.1 cell division protein FtsH [Mariprofundus ferrooxydans]